MKVEAALFNIVSVLLVAFALIYGLWAKEPIGTTALALSAGLTILIGGFFWFISRRIDARPEDRKDAEMADGAGELGFFSPSSYWPFALALSVGITGLGLAYWYFWLIAIGAVAVLAAVIAHRRRLDIPAAASLLYLGVWAANPNQAYQYYIWGIPFLLLAGHWRGVLVLQAALAVPALIVYPRWNESWLQPPYVVALVLVWLGTVAWFCCGAFGGGEWGWVGRVGKTEGSVVSPD